MIAVIDKIPISFDEFIDWYPEGSESRYKLRIVSTAFPELQLTVDQIFNPE